MPEAGLGKMAEASCETHSCAARVGRHAPRQVVRCADGGRLGGAVRPEVEAGVACLEVARIPQSLEASSNRSHHEGMVAEAMSSMLLEVVSGRPAFRGCQRTPQPHAWMMLHRCSGTSPHGVVVLRGHGDERVPQTLQDIADAQCQGARRPIFDDTSAPHGEAASFYRVPTTESATWLSGRGSSNDTSASTANQ